MDTLLVPSRAISSDVTAVQNVSLLASSPHSRQVQLTKLNSEFKTTVTEDWKRRFSLNGESLIADYSSGDYSRFHAGPAWVPGVSTLFKPLRIGVWQIEESDQSLDVSYRCGWSTTYLCAASLADYAGPAWVTRLLGMQRRSRVCTCREVSVHGRCPSYFTWLSRAMLKWVL